MAIQATAPTVVSATYDLWAFRLETHGYGCALVGTSDVPPITMTLGLRKYRMRDDGVPELSPLHTPSDYRVIDVPDLYALAAERPDVAAAIVALETAVMSYASEQGLI